MITLHYTEKAILDLDNIFFYFAVEQENEAYAETVILALRDATENLMVFPMLGAPRDDYETGLRVLIESAYLIFYSYLAVEDVVLIKRILHGHQDIENILNEET